MASIERVALAGHGRIGSYVVAELAKCGFKVTVLTRNRSAAHLANLPPGVQVQQVDYDLTQSLQEALKDQDALVSTVAMSAISNQRLLIDAAIAAGVRHFVPAEYSMATRDPGAQWLPIYSTVIDVQRYLEQQSGNMEWTAVNCGAMVEFAFDYPFVLDFDGHIATLWDGGNNALSLSTCGIVAQAIAGLLKRPERVRNHCVKVHGAFLTQRQALALAEKHTPRMDWRVQERDAEPAIRDAMAKISNGAAGSELLVKLMVVASAATFGNGYFEAGYKDPDNEWLGIKMMRESEVDEAIRRRIVEGPGFAFQFSSQKSAEGMGDVSAGLIAKYNERV